MRNAQRVRPYLGLHDRTSRLDLDGPRRGRPHDVASRGRGVDRILLAEGGRNCQAFRGSQKGPYHPLAAGFTRAVVDRFTGHRIYTVIPGPDADSQISIHPTIRIEAKCPRPLALPPPRAVVRAVARRGAQSGPGVRRTATGAREIREPVLIAFLTYCLGKLCSHMRSQCACKGLFVSLQPYTGVELTSRP